MVIAIGMAGGLLGCTQTVQGQGQTQGTDQDRTSQLRAMHEACVDAMVRSTCQALVGSAPTTPAATVVIAGVGRVDAVAYAALRDAGDAMCSLGRAACERDWQSGTCQSARALWTSPG